MQQDVAALAGRPLSVEGLDLGIEAIVLGIANPGQRDVGRQRCFAATPSTHEQQDREAPAAIESMTTVIVAENARAFGIARICAP